jgi:GDPmannose 4,6-dehydratase
LFLDESVTRWLKITIGLVSRLTLANLDARRDWGHARDFVPARWLLLQQDQSRDLIIAIGETRTVREFVESAFRVVNVVTRYVFRNLFWEVV